MINRLAYVYVYILVALMFVLLAILLSLHVAELAGHHFQVGGHLFFVFFGISMSALGLAEDRNIWAHEVKECPWWMSLLLKFLFAYAMLVMIVETLFGAGISSQDNLALAASSFMLTFSFGCTCVLYATLKSARSDPSNLRKRTQRSLITTTIFGGCYLLSLAMPHPGSH